MSIADNPQTRAENDKLGRAAFAKRIADALVEERGAARGVVIGLTGAWGSGKSTVVNFVAENLEQRGNAPVVIRFDPWIFSQTDELIQRFFLELVTKLEGDPALKKKASKVIDKLGRYGVDVASAGAAFAAELFAPGAGSLASAGARLLQRMTQSSWTPLPIRFRPA